MNTRIDVEPTNNKLELLLIIKISNRDHVKLISKSHLPLLHESLDILGRCQRFFSLRVGKFGNGQSGRGRHD